ncbi:hypothetical protein DOY81_009981 [Sarcophaga bullata]|nr:hypothetical protein DOY81_009981 [Sarcophaga bullata]
MYFCTHTPFINYILSYHTLNEIPKNDFIYLKTLQQKTKKENPKVTTLASLI